MRSLALLAAALALAGCTTARLTEPPQTAAEELLVSSAIDRAAAELKPALPAGSAVFLDAQYLDASPVVPKYAAGAVRDALLRDDLHLVADRKTAEIVIEARSGAQSIDHHDFLIGIPSFPIPIPLVATLTFPKIALYDRDRQTGIADLALTAYRARDGALAASTGATFGGSDLTIYTVLLFITWTDSNLLPEPLQQQDR